MLDTITFGLAFAAYVLVCARVVLYGCGRPGRPVSVAAAALALAHVGMVWGWRFQWSLDRAVEKGLAGFTVFHLALAGIVAAAIAPAPWAGRCSTAVFPVVTAGALGAVFRYDEVSLYRIPLVFAAGLTALLMAWGLTSFSSRTCPPRARRRPSTID